MVSKPCAGGRELKGIRPCEAATLIACGSCGAIHYCSALHQRLDWSEHKQECERYGEQMQAGARIHDFPFTFTQKATFLVDRDLITRCSFLQSYGLHCLDLWWAECDCSKQDKSYPSSGEHINSRPSSWHLPSSMCPCKDARKEKARLMSWEDYYTWRGIDLNSPIAILLHWPLTIYYAFLLIKDANGEMTMEHNSLLIHYLGPEKEIGQLEVFIELCSLLSAQHIHIEFVGPAIPTSRDGEQLELHDLPQCSDCECGCKSHGWGAIVKRYVSIRLRKGLYHCIYDNLLEQEGVPDLVIAPNAGIAAFSSWLPTLELMDHLKLPAVFTDFCEEAAILAAKCISHTVGCMLTIPVQLNPFRQPFTPPNKVLELPTYANCFLFGMK